jgi:hypothetical protein
MKSISHSLFPFVRNTILLSGISAGFLSVTPVGALTLISGPSVTGASNAPLACVLKLSTDVASRVSVSVDDGATVWERHFYDYGMAHSIPLLGFKADRTNRITLTVQDRHQNTIAAGPVNFITARLPSNFPKLVVLESKPEKMEPGYTVCRLVNGASGTDYLTILNSSGEVVWYDGNSANGASLDVRQLENGDLFFPTTTAFVEINMLGETVRTRAPAASQPIDNHDGVPTDRGTILYLTDASRVVTNFPTSNINPNAPRTNATVKYNRVVEIAGTNGVLINLWSLLDMLQPDRIDYLNQLVGGGWDAEHANAVIEDPRDDSIIVSLRNQDAVIKFSRSTGALKWILGPHENWAPAFQPYLLTPVGKPFEWNYAQHAPMLTPQGTLLLYDNGNYRASPFNTSVPDATNYSRAVEFRIDEERMEVSQVWDYGRNNSERIFTGSVGDANWLPQRQNVLITFGAISYINGVHPSAFSPGALMARIKEVTHDPVSEVVFDLAVFDYTNTSALYRGNWVYRSVRIPDLYPHPATPVVDLAIRLENAKPLLEFSADPAHAYFVETSADLVHWTNVGEATLEQSGEFEFQEEYADHPARFYRVVTE